MMTQLSTIAAQAHTALPLKVAPTQVLAAERETWFNNPVIQDSLWPATQETLLMTVFSSAFAIILGLPLGIWVWMTSKGGLAPNPVIHRIISSIVDLGRSIPFIILIIALIPFTRFMVGKAIGWEATVVPLAVGAIPFFARLAESAMREVATGKIEAVQMMGATNGQIVRQVLIPEALPALVSSATVTAVTLVSYTAMAGAVGGGGLGALAMNYGYSQYQTDTMIACIIVVVAIVIAIQMFGDWLARRVNHR
ncbi:MULTISPECIES: methionine ABC transporter permease [Micrococcaceae]|uniref:methionine ABC transporter permease n=1 Tax=Micrococcaceae TaxID=1268 RepID=UPI000B234D54|nr:MULTISPECIES: methionine ABC transporter permease [Micrococcaceae]MCG7304613.1 ABC transporter permease [Pseudoglutamicibacter albus]